MKTHTPKTVQQAAEVRILHYQQQQPKPEPKGPARLDTGSQFAYFDQPWRHNPFKDMKLNFVD
jgi:hypothetical protein